MSRNVHIAAMQANMPPFAPMSGRDVRSAIRQPSSPRKELAPPLEPSVRASFAACPASGAHSTARKSWRQVAIVAGDGIREEHILHLGPPADVVHDHWLTRHRPLASSDADVR